MSPEDRKKAIIVGVLGVVLVAVIIYQVMGATGAPPPTPTGTTAGDASGTQTTPQSQFKEIDVDLDELLAQVDDVEFDYELHRRRINPMTPKIGRVAPAAEGEGESEPAPPDPTDWVLIERIQTKTVTGIMYDDKNPLAVVDDFVVSPGDVLPDDILPNGLEIDSIGPNAVYFKAGNKAIPLYFKEQ